MSRPTKMTEEKIRQFKAICRLKPSLEDCAAFLEVNPSTIDRWCKKEHNCTFADFREQNMVHSRFMIVRNLLELCEAKNLGALIWCSKNMLGWSEKSEVEQNSKIEINIDKDDLKL